MPVRGSLNGPELVARQTWAAVQEVARSKCALGIWAVIVAWDAFISELLPERWADEWRVSGVVEKTTGFSLVGLADSRHGYSGSC